MAELRLENSIVDDRYLLDRCLGRGSYAEVFLAFDQQNDDQAVIIKALNTSLQGTPDAELDRTLVENFQNEAIALDRVHHPNIIRRLGHGTASDLEGVPFHYLVLEYMPGGDLLKLCTRRPLDLDQTLFYFQQVAEALAYAHSRQVIHRDIKPNNLLLSADHKIVKIADFGVAKMELDDSTEITRVGTNVYAPPEHHPDSRADEPAERLTPSADVYSMAKTIYTAMTGRAPRQYSRLAIAELTRELRAQPWGPSLERVLRRATESRVVDRYQSIQEFWQDLARLRLGETEEAQLAEDDEATIVRARLNATSGAMPAAAQPNFGSLAPASSIQRRHQQIVVELPRRTPPEDRVNHELQGAQTLQTQDKAQAPAPLATRTLGSEAPDKVQEKAVQPRRRLQALRRSFRVEWLRWAFIVFLIAAGIGIVASTYFHFADQRQGGGGLFGFQYKDGVIGGALNVNLRSEPSGAVLAVLPAGTRVRVMEDRGGWLRVKVVEWIGSQPDGAADTGWVGSQFVKSD
jgi:serine/threonine protein kinase